MSGFNFSDFANALSETKLSGVSFVGQAKNWGTVAEAKDLIDAINKCQKLDYLNLEGNTLGVDAANGIADALAKHPEFKQALWKDLFTGRLKTEIPLALRSLGNGMITAGANLAVLDCSDNALGPNGMTGLVDLLKSRTCFSLQELKLNNCGLGIAGGKMLAQALTECHAASLTAGTPLKLKVFIAGRNRLENDGAKALAKIFGVIQTLEEVAMPQNGIYHPGITALSDAFKLNPDLRILNLNDNTITAKGAKPLADAMELMEKLEDVNLGDCLLKTAGAIYIAEALQEGHQHLEVLNLGFNEIGPDGGLAIAASLENKLHIKDVQLNGNQFGSECRDQILEFMMQYERSDALGALDEDDSDAEDEVEEEEDDEYADEETEDGEDYDGEYVASDDENYQSGINYSNVSEGNDTFHSSRNVSLLSHPTDSPALNNFSLNNLNDSVAFVAEEGRPNTVETFCNTTVPTLAMFNALEENDKVLAFKTFLHSIPKEDYLVYMVFSILKCSTISKESNDALEVAQVLYKECFEYAEKTNQLKRVTNFFLYQLGLLKHEDKSFHLIFNVDACRSALQYAIKQNSLPSEISNTFQVFFNNS
ncbi:ran GTPase-activating protein [Bradysia coprophila]|uniref:ran GTPase-activating protein n=1 Tax=Bradysia coprophila TaxID=38358 RepID=UPI00187D7460|nr:ran GTPase-activating protein [Bradysia coprophila]